MTTSPSRFAPSALASLLAIAALTVATNASADEPALKTVELPPPAARGTFVRIGAYFTERLGVSAGVQNRYRLTP